MSYSPPTPPSELPSDFISKLNEFSSDRLRDVAAYSEDLAEYKDRETRLGESTEGDAVAEGPDDLPDEVPSKATVTIKEINDNRYYYWQWREGEKIKSKYKGPVNSDG